MFILRCLNLVKLTLLIFLSMSTFSSSDSHPSLLFFFELVAYLDNYMEYEASET